MSLLSEEMKQLERHFMMENFDGSPVSQMDRYQALIRQEDALRRRLCDGLEDKKVELLEQLWGLRDQMEYERGLYYLWRGLLLGAEGTKTSKSPGIFT